MRRESFGEFTAVAWQPLPDMTEAQWIAAGVGIEHDRGASQWCLGDWWAFGEQKYGARKALTTAPDWRGPAFQACMDAAAVARKFETSRRHEVLTFKHHRQVAALPAWQADALLDWCVQHKASTRELAARAAEVYGDTSGMPLEAVMAAMMKRCDEQRCGKSNRSRARNVVRHDIELARRVLAGDISIRAAHDLCMVASANRRDQERAANEKLCAEGAAKAAKVIRLRSAEDQNARREGLAHRLPALLAELGEVAEAHVAPVYLRERMTAQEVQQVDANATRCLRYLRLVVDTWAHVKQG